MISDYLHVHFWWLMFFVHLRIHFWQHTSTRARHAQLARKTTAACVGLGRQIPPKTFWLDYWGKLEFCFADKAATLWLYVLWCARMCKIPMFLIFVTCSFPEWVTSVRMLQKCARHLTPKVWCPSSFKLNTHAQAHARRLHARKHARMRHNCAPTLKSEATNSDARYAPRFRTQPTIVILSFDFDI